MKQAAADRAATWIGLGDIRCYKLHILICYMRKLAHLKPKAPQRSPLYLQLEIIFLYIS